MSDLPDIRISGVLDYTLTLTLVSAEDGVAVVTATDGHPVTVEVGQPMILRGEMTITADK